MRQRHGAAIGQGAQETVRKGLFRMEEFLVEHAKKNGFYKVLLY